MPKEKLIIVTTVPITLDKILFDQIVFLRKYFSITIVSSNQHELSRIAKRAGVDFYYLNLTRRITPILDLLVIFKFFTWLIKERPTIVSTTTPKANLVGIVAAKLARVPYRIKNIAGLVHLDDKGLKYSLLDLSERLGCRLSTLTYVNSIGLGKVVMDLGYCPKNKVRMIGHGSTDGVDTNYFYPRSLNRNIKETLIRDLNIKTGDVIVMFSGRLVPDKGLNELVLAFNSIESTSIKLLLVGSYEEDLYPVDESIKRIIISNENILHVGQKKDIRSYLSISDIFILPSYREGFPNVLLEAGAMELPCITTNITGSNEIIENNFNGLIIPIRNVEEIKKSIVSLANNRNLRMEMASKARKRIVNNYDREIFHQLLIKEYKNLGLIGNKLI